MNIIEQFPTRFLKCSDLAGKQRTVTITGVENENIQNQNRQVVYFKEAPKPLVLNKTNALAIASLLNSAETDDWGGKKITLYPTLVDFQGRRVDAIRVSAAKQQPASAQASAAAADNGGFLEDDELPPPPGDEDSWPETESSWS